jgi:prephenate dehydrogenase
LKTRLRAPFKRITIIGLGLIGGSLGLTIKKKFPSARVIGLDKPSVLRIAKQRRMIDAGASTIREAVSEADLILLCTPISVSRKLLPTIARWCRPEALVTDTGSVKAPIMKLASSLFPRGNFIGGHPMSGSEKSGIAAAQGDLFERAPWILTLQRTTPKKFLKSLRAFLSALRFRVIVLSGKSHDAHVAMISHLPQLAAVGLVNVAGKHKSLHLAGRGFRDMTRIAASDFKMWKDILSSNRAEVKRALGFFIRELENYRGRLAGGRMEAHFRKAKRLRATLKAS